MPVAFVHLRHLFLLDSTVLSWVVVLSLAFLSVFVVVVLLVMSLELLLLAVPVVVLLVLIFVAGMIFGGGADFFGMSVALLTFKSLSQSGRS